MHMTDFDKSIIEEFYEEALELLDSMDGEIGNFDSLSRRDNALKDIERGLHTIKGNANALGFSDYGSVCSILSTHLNMQYNIKYI